MKKHEWRETTEEGETRLLSFSRHGGKWEFRARLKSDAEWTKFPVIPLDDLESLREVLEKKYRRNRIPEEHITEVEALIEVVKRRG